MKQKSLLVSAAMLLFGTAYAGVWEKPAVTGQPLATDGETEQYLYNTEACAFALGANDWNTRASVSPAKGYRWKVTSTGEGVYSFTDYVETKNAWIKTFVDAPTGIWVDNDNGANCDKWTIIPIEGGNSFKISNAAFEGQFLGVGANAYNYAYGDTRLYLSSVFAEDAPCVEWISVGAEEYESLITKLPLYLAGTGLETAVEKAKAAYPSASFASAASVAGDVTSTLDTLKSTFVLLNARVALLDAIAKGKAVNAALTFAKASALAEGETATKADLDAALAIVNARVNLATAIAEAKAKFATLDLAEEESVAANEDATVEECNKASESVAEKLRKAEAEAAQNSATVADPKDLTSMLVNPSFDNNNATGWTGTGFGFQSYTNAEHYNKVFDTYQQVGDMPKGVFKLSATGFYRAGFSDVALKNFNAGTGKNALLYTINVKENGADTLTAPVISIWQDIDANNPLGLTFGTNGDVSEVILDGVKYYCPNNMNAAHRYVTELDAYHGNELLFAVSEGTAKIGIKKSTTINGDWTIFDDFSLTYYGNGEDAYTLLIADVKKNAALAADIVCTKSLISEFDEFVAGLSAANYEEYYEAVTGIAAKKAEIAANEALWKKYIELVKQADDICNDGNYMGIDEVEDLADEVQTARGIIEELELSTEELQEAYDALKELYDICLDLTPAGTDVTAKYLKNIDFSQGTTAWYGFNGDTGGGNARVDTNAKCGEAWNKASFDIYQTVENVKSGVYEIQVQGFYRYLRGDNAWNAYFNEDGSVKATKPEVPAYVYMNDAKTPLTNVFSYQSLAKDSLYKGTDFYADKVVWTDTIDGEPVDVTGKYAYPNDMTSAGKAFDKNKYVVSALGLVGDGEPMRIGMKGSSNQGNDSWAIFTRFKLVYQAYKLEIVKALLESNLESLNIEKMRENADSENQFIGADIKLYADSLYAVGADALELTDGKAMYNVLSKLLASIEPVQNSIALFAELNSAFDAFSDVFNSSRDDARPTVVAEAEEFINGLAEGLEAWTLTDQDAKDAIVAIKRLSTQLKFPAEALDATDEQPFELTEMIANPSFEQNTTVTQEIIGWTNSGSIGMQSQINTAFGKDGNTYAERWHVDGTLDLNQTLEGLAAGTYGITAVAHCSTGDGVIYVNDQIQSISNLDAPATPNEETVYVTIEENESIKFGVRASLTTSTWCCVDNFKLFYYGTESAHDNTAIETIASEAVKTQIFDINGRATNALTQGINIVRRVDAQGNMKTYKVIVK